MPVDIAWKPLASLTPGKTRLVGAMTQSKEQYDEYLANPCMPHFTSEMARIAPLREIPPLRSPYGLSPVNFGLIERFLPTTWPKEGTSSGPPLFRVDAMHIGHRFLWPMLYVVFVLVSCSSQADRFFGALDSCICGPCTPSSRFNCRYDRFLVVYSRVLVLKPPRRLPITGLSQCYRNSSTS